MQALQRRLRCGFCLTRRRSEPGRKRKQPQGSRPVPIQGNPASQDAEFFFVISLKSAVQWMVCSTPSLFAECMATAFLLPLWEQAWARSTLWFVHGPSAVYSYSSSRSFSKGDRPPTKGTPRVGSASQNTCRDIGARDPSPSRPSSAVARSGQSPRPRPRPRPRPSRHPRPERLWGSSCVFRFSSVRGSR